MEERTDKAVARSYHSKKAAADDDHDYDHDHEDDDEHDEKSKCVFYELEYWNPRLTWDPRHFVPG